MLCAGKCLRRVNPLLSHKKRVESCISGWSGLMKTLKNSWNFIINQGGYYSSVSLANMNLYTSHILSLHFELFK